MRLIGIDPDCEKTGVAILEYPLRLTLQTLLFWDLIAYLETLQPYQQRVRVVVEAGWLNTKANFHTQGKGERVGATVGAKVGANWEVGRLIVAYCKRNNISVEARKPLKKCWGKDGKQKISHAEFIRLRGVDTNLKRSNQEQRDAALLIL